MSFRHFGLVFLLVFSAAIARAEVHNYGLLGPLYRGQQATFVLNYTWVDASSKWSVTLQWQKSLAAGKSGDAGGNTRAYAVSGATGMLNSYDGWSTGQSGTAGPFLLNVGAEVRVQVEYITYGEAVIRSFTLPPKSQSQTVTASLSGAGAHEADTSLTGSASGAQGGNQYHASIVGTGASVIINPTSGVFVVTAAEVGSYTVQVWAEAGNGYARSNDATIEGTVIDTRKNKVTLRLDNRGNVGQKFFARQDGSRIAEWLLASDEVRVVTLETPTLSPVTIETEGARQLVDGVWTATPDNVIDPAGTYSPERVGGNVTPPESPTPAKGGATPQAPTPESGKSVWTSITGDNITNNITNATFAEGADKIVKAIADLKGVIPSGGGSGTGTIDDPDEDDFEMEGYDGENLPSLVDGVLENLPDAPSILAPESASSPIFVSPLFKIGNIEIQREYDLTPYIGAIQPFRIVSAGVVGVLFFILYVRTIKGAFAS